MKDKLKFLIDGLATVKTSGEFEDWVRTHLRRIVPHSSFLCTFGQLFGMGSVATHRVGVDFPLNLAEEMKDKCGANDDPLVCRWFESGKVRFLRVPAIEAVKKPEKWQATLRHYGVENMLVHGVLDHVARRFMLVQVCNLPDVANPDIAHLFTEFVGTMAKVGWNTVDSRRPASPRQLTGHPTIALTSTEVQIIGFLSLGLSNKEISRRRGVSSSTIKTQVSRIGAKLGATRRSEMVARGMSMLSLLPAQGVVSYDD